MQMMAEKGQGLEGTQDVVGSVTRQADGGVSRDSHRGHENQQSSPAHLGRCRQHGPEASRWHQTWCWSQAYGPRSCPSQPQAWRGPGFSPSVSGSQATTGGAKAGSDWGLESGGVARGH